MTTPPTAQEDPVTAPHPLAAQQQLLRDALDVLALRESPDDDPAEWSAIHGRIRTWLRYALTDHDDPDTGCLARPGEECSAVAYARKIVQGAA